MTGWRSQALECGLFLVCAVLPLAFLPPAHLPFADAKPLILTAGATMVWVSGVRPDRRLAAPALALAAIAVAATLAGVDPLESLYGTARPTGLVMLLPALTLVVVAPNLAAPVLERMRRWIVGAALVAAALALIEHVFPAVLDPVLRSERFTGGTFGNPVILAGFLALALAANLAGPADDRVGRRVPAWVTPLVLGSAFGVIGERSAYLLPVVAVVVAWWLGRPDRARLIRAVAALVLGIAVWSFVPPIGGTTSSSAVVSQFETSLGERQRLAVATANARGVLERPVLGWGPANAWSAFLSSGTREEIRTATRTWGDAHNLPLQFAVTTGVLGLVALLWLAERVLLAARPRSAIVPWAAAGALTLLAFSLYEPLDPTLTPLLFLLAGASLAGASLATAATDAETTTTGLVRGAGVVVTVALGAGVAVSALSIASSTLEQWGRTHYATRWALEDAMTIAPWRLTTVEALAIDLALDGRSGDDAVAERARSLVADAVADHPDNPGVRLLGADVEILLRDEDAARGWIDRQLERFPSDTVRVPTDRVPGGSSTLGPS